jgi:hypothetical protein
VPPGVPIAHADPQSDCADGLYPKTVAGEVGLGVGSTVRVGVNDGVLVGVGETVIVGVIVGVGVGDTGTKQSHTSVIQPVLLTLTDHSPPPSLKKNQFVAESLPHVTVVERVASLYIY